MGSCLPLKGLILAGGLGTRLRPTTKVINKHLLNIYDQPLIFYPIKTLRDIGITDIVLSLGEHDCERFYDLLGSGKELGVDLTYHYHGEPKGIAYAINSALDEIDTDRFVVHLGDNIFTDSEDLQDFVELSYDYNGVVIKEVLRKDTHRYGVVYREPWVEGKQAKYFFEEKPKSIPLNCIVEGIMLGFYIFNKNDYREAFEKCSPSTRGEYEITDVFSRIYDTKKNLVFNNYWSDWYDCGQFEDLYKASTWRRECVLG